MTITSTPTLQTKLQVAIQAAEAAGAIQREYYGKPQVVASIETKSSYLDLVTHVDKLSDKLIREHLQAAFPKDALLTEESFEETHTIDLTAPTWVVDPVDGTTNFAHSFPHFAVSIAYVEHNQPLIAVVYDTMKQECFTAIRDEGAFVSGPLVPGNQQRLQVSPVNSIKLSLLATGFSYDPNLTIDEKYGSFHRFMANCHGVRRAGSAALDLAYVAAGRLDGFWEGMLSPWDVAAGALLVEEAGGRITNYQGQPLNYAERRIFIVGSNNQANPEDGTLHEQMLLLI